MGDRNQHFLDTLPLDYSRPESLELRDLLAGSYRKEQDICTLLDKVQIPPAYINLSQPNIYIWHDILTEARNRDVLRGLIDCVLQDKTKSALHSRIKELLAKVPVREATDSGDMSGPEPDTETLERIIGRSSTLIDICFLEGGLRVSPAIGRLLVSFGPGASNTFWGSGFLVEAPGLPLLVTNYHVLYEQLKPGAAPASRVEIWFGYELGLDGKPKELHKAMGDISSIQGDASLDWAAIRLREHLPDSLIKLPLKSPAKPVEPFDRAYIIQHPKGGMKKIGMHHNDIFHVDDHHIQYVTDTDQGSSGSPVFNEQWELIALHHRYVQIPMGDKAPPVYRNQGVRIEQVMAGLINSGLLKGPAPS